MGNEDCNNGALIDVVVEECEDGMRTELKRDNVELDRSGCECDDRLLNDVVIEECGDGLRDVLKECREDNVVSGRCFDTIVKEVSNEDLRSEVTNPVVCLNEYGSGQQDITSQIVGELGNSNCSNRVRCSGVTSEDLSENSNSIAEETVSNGTFERSRECHVAVEIPERVSTTGIRKIRFKFSRTEVVYSDLGICPANCSVEEYGKYWDHFKESRCEDFVDEEKYNSFSKLQPDYREIDFCPPNMELKMSKKVLPNNYPTNVKKLLSTGILDGARVKYISPTGKKQLDGVVDGGGYLCGCSSCKYTRVLSAYEFEQHAGSRTRHPNNHIYLESGKPIYSIIQELKTAPLCTLDQVIKGVAGSSLNEVYFQAWKVSFYGSNEMLGENKHIGLSRSLPSQPGEYNENGSASLWSYVQKDMSETSGDRCHNSKKRRSFFPNSVSKNKKSTELQPKRRDNELHKLVFKPNGLPDGAELAYVVKGQKLCIGHKEGSVIVCSCCSKKMTPSQFENHAGMGGRRQPYRHICTSDKRTLHDIALSLANGENLVISCNAGMCTICPYGAGDLVHCNGCNRAFHAAYLELKFSPESLWNCPDCSISSSSSRRNANVGESENLMRPELERGSCVICRDHEFSSGTHVFNDQTVILCDQCDKEFHVGCLRENGLCDLKELPKEMWFCCGGCSMINFTLEELVSKGEELVADTSSIIRKHAKRGLKFEPASCNVRWRVMHGTDWTPDQSPMLSRAVEIFKERFDPIEDENGNDLIKPMVFGETVFEQDFSRMYTALLIVNSVVVSVGLFKIFDQGLAELPLVATCKEQEGRGHFEALFSCIWDLLQSLKVRKLVLPAADDAIALWTKKFGFKRMRKERSTMLMRDIQLTVFRDTSMLEKELLCYLAF